MVDPNRDITASMSSCAAGNDVSRGVWPVKLTDRRIPLAGRRRSCNVAILILTIIFASLLAPPTAHASNTCVVIPPYYMAAYFCDSLNPGSSVTSIPGTPLPDVSKNRGDSRLLFLDVVVGASMKTASSGWTHEYALVSARGLAISSFPPKSNRDAATLYNYGSESWQIKGNMYSIDQ